MYFTFLTLLLISCASALIVPEELPSLLSVAYSNIPPIKKGTDSRVGFGFSLGNHADFQVVFELGPQTNTNPIGTSYASSSKRQVTNNKPKTSTKSQTDSGKYLENWSQTVKKANKPFLPLPIPDTPHGAVNLHDLLTNMKDNSEDTMEGEIVLKQPVPLNIPKDALMQLKRLYGDKVPVEEDVPMFVPKQPSRPRTPKPVRADKYNADRLSQFNLNDDEKSEDNKKKITEELSNVNLDDE